MRHAAARPRVRRGRACAAVASALTVIAAVLGASGALPLGGVRPDGPTTAALTADRLADRPGTDAATSAGTGADRSRGAEATSRGRGTGRGSAAGPSPATSGSSTPGATVPAATSAPTASGSAGSRTARGRPLPANSGHGKRVVYALGAQHVWLVDASGKVRRDYPVSGSKYDQVQVRTYHVIRKRLHTTSYTGADRMNYMVTFMFGENAAIGFHDIPVDLATGRPVQTRDELGTPLSDGCVRQLRSDARALWNFAPRGTPVVVVA